VTESERTRLLAAAFLHVRVGELIPHLREVVSNTSVARTKYLARCPSCDAHTFSFSQSRNGIAAACSSGCSAESIAAGIIQRRVEAGEHPENVWGRADRLLKGEEWNP
jgi:hypothetical protein